MLARHRHPPRFSHGFGKDAKWKRAVDFATFIASCSLKLLTIRRPDVIVALTSPPLISFVGALFARLKRCRLIYWVMDLNPDEAIVAGWLNERSLVARLLQRMSLFSLRQSEAIVVLDRFMKERVLAKGIPADQSHVIPPWSHDDAVRFDAVARERFRQAHGLAGKFVVMYSGNHSPCHPLDTLLSAAEMMKDDPQFAFCFVGGGSEFAKVKRFATEKVLQNITCLPYQPLNELSGSLSAADLHVVVMGNRFVGTIHPCKIYNILTVGAPFLYLGPRPSHITDILDELPPSDVCSAAEHGDVDAVVRHIRTVARRGERTDSRVFENACQKFSRDTLLPQLLHLFQPAALPLRSAVHRTVVLEKR
jgi:hypothetical protein